MKEEKAPDHIVHGGQEVPHAKFAGLKDVGGIEEI